MKLSALLACLCFAGIQVASAETAVVDAKGCLNALAADGEYCAIRASLRIPEPGWGRSIGQDAAENVQSTIGDEGGNVQGRISLAAGRACAYEQSVDYAPDGSVRMTYTITAEAAFETEGVYLFIDIPIAEFAGGSCEFTDGDQSVGNAELQREFVEPHHLLAREADTAVITDDEGNRTLRVNFGSPLPLTIQDSRMWNGSDFTLFATLARGDLAAGQKVEAQVSFAYTAQGDHSPVELTIDTERELYTLDGFGGNYCFNIESPVTQYTLANLNVRWARTEMTPGEWEPENDNASPDETDWAKLEDNDKPGSNLRREFELARQIQDKGIPYAISIWILPEWLYVDPGRGPEAHGRIVPPGKWPELFECLGSYLVYAKRQYGVEPDLFSFNEPDYGVRVKLTPEEHCRLTRELGAHFESLGLRTKMLLADVANCRGTHTYALPTAEDPEAMKHVGAIAFHSWGGATPEQYGAWADLAKRLDLPLLVAELGVDAGAWRSRSYDSFHYALREVAMYQDLVRYAQPQGTMQWEFTADYGIAKHDREADEVRPTVRFWFVKHFCDLTPTPARVLASESDNDRVTISAFRGEDGALTVHIANLGAAREATLTGLPDDLALMRVVLTSETESYGELGPVAIDTGQVRLALPTQSLLTLTTLPAV